MELENEKLKSLLETTEKNQNCLIQELVKTVQHLSSQIEKLERTTNDICEKINTMDPFSKRPEAN
jgi:uncharacterized protein YoxC